MMRSQLIAAGMLAGVALLFAGGSGIWAGQDNAPMPRGSDVCYEYSNDFDEQAIAGGGGHDGLRPGMVLYTEPPDAPGPPNPQSIRQLNLGVSSW